MRCSVAVVVSVGQTAKAERLVGQAVLASAVALALAGLHQAGPPGLRQAEPQPGQWTKQPQKAPWRTLRMSNKTWGDKLFG